MPPFVVHERCKAWRFWSGKDTAFLQRQALTSLMGPTFEIIDIASPSLQVSMGRKGKSHAAQIHSMAIGHGTAVLHAIWRSRNHQKPALVPREVVVVVFSKAGVQVPIWQVNRAQAGRVDALEEEVVDERIVVALIVHVVGVRDLVASPARRRLLWVKLPAQCTVLE